MLSVAALYRGFQADVHQTGTLLYCMNVVRIKLSETQFYFFLFHPRNYYKL